MAFLLMDIPDDALSHPAGDHLLPYGDDTGGDLLILHDLRRAFQAISDKPVLINSRNTHPRIILQIMISPAVIKVQQVDLSLRAYLYYPLTGIMGDHPFAYCRDDDEPLILEKM